MESVTRNVRTCDHFCLVARTLERVGDRWRLLVILLRSAIRAIDLAADDRQPARWHFRLDDADYLAESHGQQWSLTARTPAAPAGVDPGGS